VPTCIKREQLWHAIDFLAHLLHELFHAGVKPDFRVTLMFPSLDLAHNNGNTELRAIADAVG
jgi:hypothetical protein